ncbi:hypothetical protein JKY72_07155 [Candidatus Gracilibacteria bacterium]|nr:hypothetical protein [Candidatus Gracilibacteria bacterium]
MKSLNENALVFMTSLLTACTSPSIDDVFPVDAEAQRAKADAVKCGEAMELVGGEVDKSIAFLRAMFEEGEVVLEEDIVFSKDTGSDLFEKVFGLDPDATESEILALDGGDDSDIRLVQCRLRQASSDSQLLGECVGRKAYMNGNGEIEVFGVGGPSPLPEDDQPGWFDDKGSDLLYVDKDTVDLNAKYTLLRQPNFTPRFPGFASKGGCTVIPPFVVDHATGYPKLHNFEPVSRCLPADCDRGFAGYSDKVRQIIGSAVSGALKKGGRR